MNFSFGWILVVSHYTKSLTDTVIIILYGFCILYLRRPRELIPVPSQCYSCGIMCVQYETGVSLVVQIVKNLHAMQETQVQSLGQEDPLEKEWLSTPVFLPGEFHGQRSLVGYSPWGCKESDTTEWLNCTCYAQSPSPQNWENKMFTAMQKHKGVYC